MNGLAHVVINVQLTAQELELSPRRPFSRTPIIIRQVRPRSSIRPIGDDGHTDPFVSDCSLLPCLLMEMV